MEGKALGDNKPAYIRILRSWFKRHYFKEDFDPSVLFLLPPEEVLLHNRYLTAILVKHMQTYTKQARRRSKSVDHYVGERTVIAPELCQICEASKKSRRPEESPTLPWCPHNSYLTNPSITINVTPARSKSFLFKVFILILFTLLMIMILFCQALPFFFLTLFHCRGKRVWG